MLDVEHLVGDVIVPNPITTCSVKDELSKKPRRAMYHGPPEGWHWREECEPAARDFVEQRCPELLDLVEQGSLFVFSRPANHVDTGTQRFVISLVQDNCNFACSMC